MKLIVGDFPIISSYGANIAKKGGVNFLAYRCDISSKKIFIDKKLKIIDD